MDRPTQRLASERVFDPTLDMAHDDDDDDNINLILWSNYRHVSSGFGHVQVLARVCFDCVGIKL